jgi:hypothetical protein
MAKKVWRHILSKAEQKLWDREDMKGWCKALEGCIEDDAREGNCKKYTVQNAAGETVAKGDVSALPEPKSEESTREPASF